MNFEEHCQWLLNEMNIYEQRFPSHSRRQKNIYFKDEIKKNINLAEKELEKRGVEKHE